MYVCIKIEANLDLYNPINLSVEESRDEFALSPSNIEHMKNRRKNVERVSHKRDRRRAKWKKKRERGRERE